MAWKFWPIGGPRGEVLHSESIDKWRPYDGERTFVTSSAFLAHGLFKATTLSGAGTTTLASAPPGGSLIITDLVVSAKRANNSTLTVRFSDGTNTETLISPDTVNQSTNFSWVPVGRLHGWLDADLEVVITGSLDATVTAGYVKISDALVYSEWDGLR